MNKPREFWIEGKVAWNEEAISPKVLEPERFVHVIEYSAYKEAMDRLTEVCAKQVLNEHPQLFQNLAYQEQIDDLVKERDEYREALERASHECATACFPMVRTDFLVFIPEVLAKYPKESK